MDRRDLLKAGAAAALAGCASAPRPDVRAVVPMSAADVDGALADMDATIARLSQTASRPDLYVSVVRPGETPHLPALDAPRIDQAHNLVQRTFAALHIATTFRELPPEAQAREDTQRRMWRAMPLLDSAVMDMAEYMSSLSAEDRRKIQREIDRDPDLVMNIVGTLDEQAAHVGVPQRRRTQLRMAGANVAWRTSKQSVDALLGEMLGKVDRVKERHGRDEELKRAMAAKVAEAQLFGAQDDPTAHLMLSAQVTQAQHEHREKKAAVVLGIGGALFGVGAALGVLGVVVLSSGDIAGAFAITFAVLFGVAGLVMIIVGAVLSASAEHDEIVDQER